MSEKDYTQNLTISPMTEWDLDEVAEIEKEAFSTHAWSRALFEDELKDGTKYYLIARSNGRVLGYGGFAHIGDEAHIMNIAVRETARRKGIGRALLQAILKKAAELKITAATLEVSCYNLPAIALYKDFGFVSAGIRPDYYDKGEGAFILWAYL